MWDESALPASPQAPQKEKLKLTHYSQRVYEVRQCKESSRIWPLALQRETHITDALQPHARIGPHFKAEVARALTKKEVLR